MHTFKHSQRAAGLLIGLALLTGACNDPSSSVNDAQFASNPSVLLHRSGSGAGASGSSAGFSVLANAAVTCTDGTIIGDVGTFAASPVGSFTQTTCPLTGSAHVGDGAAIQAYNAFLSAYTALAPQAGDVCPIITGTLAGQSFAPGVYCVSAEAKTGVVTLNGPANGIWIFKVAPGAFTGTSFSVVLAGNAQACNVIWWVDAATTMTDSNLKGTVLSGAGITLTRGTFNGNAYAKADVTVTGTAVTGCAGGVQGGGNGGHDGDDHGNGHGKDKDKCNQGRGNGREGCDPGNSNHKHDSNDEGDWNRGGRRNDR